MRALPPSAAAARIELPAKVTRRQETARGEDQDAQLPKLISSAAHMTKYSALTHSTLTKLQPRSPTMAGRASPTVAASRMIMARSKTRKVSESQRWSRTLEAGAPCRGWVILMSAP